METKKMLFVALFAAFVAVLGYIPPIPIPFIPAPITMQTLGVMLAGSILGRLGGLSMIVFVLLGAVGAPVFSGGIGGAGHILGPTGGFILSWPVAAFVIGVLAEKLNQSNRRWRYFAFHLLGGVMIVYAIGTPYLAFIADVPVSKAFIGSLIFIPGDLFKAYIAAVIAEKVVRAYPLQLSTKNQSI